MDSRTAPSRSNAHSQDIPEKMLQPAAIAASSNSVEPVYPRRCASRRLVSIPSRPPGASGNSTLSV